MLCAHAIIYTNISFSSYSSKCAYCSSRWACHRPFRKSGTILLNKEFCDPNECFSLGFFFQCLCKVAQMFQLRETCVVPAGVEHLCSFNILHLRPCAACAHFGRRTFCIQAVLSFMYMNLCSPSI